ncbi:MAG: cell division protein ZapA [Nitrospirae bacterium]|nr:MAG: cell division protein ZapA [Nitrospirota bacterium]
MKRRSKSSSSIPPGCSGGRCSWNPAFARRTPSWSATRPTPAGARRSGSGSGADCRRFWASWSSSNIGRTAGKQARADAQERRTTVSQRFEVEIYGQRYAIRGEADQSYVNELAREVDEQMRTLAGGMKVATPAKVAILAALNLAHQLHQARKFQHEKVEQMADSLISSIEETLGGAR